MSRWTEQIDPENRPPIRDFLWLYAAAAMSVIVIRALVLVITGG